MLTCYINGAHTLFIFQISSSLVDIPGRMTYKEWMRQRTYSDREKPQAPVISRVYSYAINTELLLTNNNMFLKLL